MDCDDPFDEAVVVHGGFDDYVDWDDLFGGDCGDDYLQFEDGVFLISADVPVVITPSAWV